ncbi:MAG TPA: accessory factor UbiK family protein [Alphaproteobacteria bacterium]|nr:accessory factor UbiK family protein [Alphaproteobacteria bacterium]
MFDDMARVASGAAGAFGGFRSRMEGELRDQVERLLGRMNLVTREEHEIALALAQKARAEQEILAERLAALEAKLGIAPKAAAAKTAPKARPRGTAKPKPAPRRRGGT